MLHINSHHLSEHVSVAARLVRAHPSQRPLGGSGRHRRAGAGAAEPHDPPRDHLTDGGQVQLEPSLSWMVVGGAGCVWRGCDGPSLLVCLRDGVLQSCCVASIVLLVVSETLDQIVLRAGDGQTTKLQFLFQLGDLEDEKHDKKLLSGL